MKKISNNSALSKLMGKSANPSPGGSSTKLPANNQTRASSFTSGNVPNGVSFGKESKAAQGTTGSSSSSELANFLQNTLAHGLGAATSGLFGSSSSSSSLLGSALSGLGGIGSLVSGLAGLFGGGKSQPAPLPAFTLPGSEIQSVSVNTSQANVVTGEQSASAAGNVTTAPPNTQYLENQQQQIAQAVKTALLQSHSLSDVISEL